MNKRTRRNLLAFLSGISISLSLLFMFVSITTNNKWVYGSGSIILLFIGILSFKEASK